MSEKSTYTWDAEDYARHSTAQQSWAQELIYKLRLTGNESVLDIGCGDGKITAQIAAHLPNGHIIGVDSSHEMIQLSRKTFSKMQYPNLSFEIADARSLRFYNQFDIVFSNAALHWIKHHEPVLNGVKNCLKNSGHLLFQMGGKGNAAAIINTLEAMICEKKWHPYFHDFSFPYGFHDAENYKIWLKNAGFISHRVEMIPKTMSYDNKKGLAGWIRTTWLPYTDRIPKSMQNEFISQLVKTYIHNFPLDKNGKIHIDMVRLEVEATCS